MKEFVSHSIAETEQIAQEWVRNIFARKGKHNDEAALIALNGNLGSGKTTFTQYVAKALGITENITSPTFVIMKRYKIPTGFAHLIHIDAYRLEKGEELEVLDFKKIVADPTNLVLIEWADNVKSGLPVDSERIDFEYVNENERKITFS